MGAPLVLPPRLLRRTLGLRRPSQATDSARGVPGLATQVVRFRWALPIRVHSEYLVIQDRAVHPVHHVLRRCHGATGAWQRRFITSTE